VQVVTRPSVVHCAWHARAVLGQQLSGEGQQSVPVASSRRKSERAWQI